MTYRYRLRLLGPVQLEDTGSSLRNVVSRKALAIMAYLAQHPQPLAREHLADLFWHTKTEARGRRNLSRELSELGAQLPGCLQADFHTVWWPAETWVDTAAFQQLAADASLAAPAAPDSPDEATSLNAWSVRRARPGLDLNRLTEAIRLYRGEFMAGFYLDGCAEFEAWLIRERERWRRNAAETLEQLIAHHALHGQNDQAQGYARRWLELEPWQEEAHYALMLLLAHNGKRGAALAQYEACRQALTDELGIAPTASTIALVERIRAGDLDKDTRQHAGQDIRGREAGLVSLPSSLSTPTPVQDWGTAPQVEHFYGRQADLATLERWLAGERCRVVAILGMGGMGKTMLASQAARQNAHHYDVVIWRSLLNAPPFAELLHSCIPLLSAREVADPPRRLDDQITLLLDLFRRRRCLLVLDNCESILQPGARAGTYRPGYEEYGQLIRHVGEGTHQSCLLLTSREQPQEVALLQGTRTANRSLHLAGLDGNAGQQVLQSHGLSDPEPAAAHLITRYSGNPLALHIVAETVKDLFGGDLATFLRAETLIFDNVRDLLDQQWLRLTRLEQDILFWLAIEREALTPEALRANLLGGSTTPALLEALRSLRRRSLIEQQGAGFTLQNVVMEYATDHLIALVCQELETGSWERFHSHALIRAQAKEYVRESQVRLILAPIARQLVTRLGRMSLEQTLKAQLAALRERAVRAPSYAGGNVLNLLLHLGYDLSGSDFSGLCLWQADLQGVRLPEINLAHADLTGSVFTDAFRTQQPLAWSPDGALLAAAVGAGEICLWRVADRQVAGVCAGHTGYVLSIVFSPDGQLLASSAADQTVRVWDLRSFQAIHTLRGHARIVSTVAWSPDGVRLISAGFDQTIRLWDARSGQALQTLVGHSNVIYALSLSTDGALLASGSFDGTIILWDARELQPIRTLDPGADVLALAFSPDGDLLASGSHDNIVRVWNTHSGDIAYTCIGTTHVVRSVAFSPNGLALASGGDSTARIWDAPSGQLRMALHGHTHPISAVVWSPDGAQLASMGGDLIRVWNPDTGQIVATIRGHSDEVLSVAFSPDGTTLASSHVDNIIRLWDVANWHVRHLLHGHTGWTRDVRFTPDGATLISASFDQTVRLWDVSSGRLVRILHGHNDWIDSLALDADGASMATGSKDETVWLWDVQRAHVVHVLRGHSGTVAGLAFSPDGALLATGGVDTIIRLWDTRRGQALATLAGHSKTVHSLAFDPSGTMLISASADETVGLWDVPTGRRVGTLHKHTAVVCELALSRDGAILASCGASDQTVRLWDMTSAALLRTLQHPSWVVTVDISPDGSTLVSGSEDGMLRLWNINSGACLRTLRAPGPYAGMNITGVTGVTEAQHAALRALGAVEE